MNKAIIITIVLVTIVAIAGSDILIALLRAVGLITGNGILG